MLCLRYVYEWRDERTNIFPSSKPPSPSPFPFFPYTQFPSTPPPFITIGNGRPTLWPPLQCRGGLSRRPSSAPRDGGQGPAPHHWRAPPRWLACQVLEHQAFHSPGATFAGSTHAGGAARVFGVYGGGNRALKGGQGRLLILFLYVSGRDVCTVRPSDLILEHVTHVGLLNVRFEYWGRMLCTARENRQCPREMILRQNSDVVGIRPSMNSVQ